MGDVNLDTARKCILGLANDLIHGKPVSPSVQEDCAVTARELREAAEKAKAAAQQQGAKQARKGHGSKANHSINPEKLKQLRKELREFPLKSGQRYFFQKVPPQKNGEFIERFNKLSPKMRIQLREMIQKIHLKPLRTLQDK